MKYCILITGLLRQFTKTLYPFLLDLEQLIDFDLYIYTSRDNFDTNYLNKNSVAEYDTLLNNPRCKLFVFDNSNLSMTEHMRERDKNIYYQWHKLHKCFQYIPKDTYDFIIRIRPDINMLQSPNSFVDLLQTLNKDNLYIPSGNDRLSSGAINDQFAIGNYINMEKYCKMFTCLITYHEKGPLISEKLLYTYLEREAVPTERINIPYSINLSDCIVVAITGDSGSGKSTVLQAIQKVFPFDSKLVLETDRYHKWERDDEKWASITHLHPEANHLEKLVDDTFHLKMGNTVCSVDYDHRTGKFTAPHMISPKNFLLLCGLHTLYKEKLRNAIDIKIYVDTEESLKNYWKVKRDSTKRQQSPEKIRDTIEKRKADFQQYIDPQKQHANLLFKYWYDLPIPCYTDELDPSHIKFGIECKLSLLSYLSHILYSFSLFNKKTQNDTIFFEINPAIAKSDIIKFIRQENFLIESEDVIEDSYLGVVQVIILQLLLT